MKRITPLITVEAIEPCLPFWTELGFEVAATVPHEDTIGFAMLTHGDLLLMYQTQASVADDLGKSGAPESLPGQMGSGVAALFVEVEDLESVIAATAGTEVLVPRRTTFYGMDEIFVRAPCGTVVGFAERVEGESEG